MIEMLQADDWKDLNGIRHGFFCRTGGVSKGIYESLNCGLSSADDQNDVAENRRRVALHMGVKPENLLSCYQVHSPDVVTVGEIWKPVDRPRADALVTRGKGIALGILTADCVPVLFADSEVGVIGAAHAGWRGAISGVIENTLKAMEDLGANRKSIRVALGPCIWQNSYEVGPEFPAPFVAEDHEHKKFFKPAFKSDRYMFDLPGYVTDKLRRFKVAAVEASPADTAADETRFFSYRRNCLVGNKTVASLISVIVLAG